MGFHTIDFNEAPLLVIWEVTRACGLACRHCRASAIDWRDPRELSLVEGKKMIDDVAKMGTPLIVFTGGDPLQREDLEKLIRHAKGVGLHVGTIPATTSRLTKKRLASLKEAGVDQIAFSIDGADAEKHDAFRRVEGAFDKAIEAAAWVRELQIPLQINTVLGSWNYEDFDAIASLVSGLGVVFWEVFFLVPVGRGKILGSCTAEQYEALFEKIYRLSQRVPFKIKLTEAQHYRRYVMEQSQSAKTPAARAVNAGCGFCFVDHLGNVCPSGFLPLVCGNVRQQSIIDVYRHSKTFQELRDLSLLKGRCGVCKFKDVCGGGSRARAYAMASDYQADEPFCLYRLRPDRVR